MRILNLDGRWTLQQAGEKREIPARVPGDVMCDLVRAKVLPDPYDRENERAVQWVGERDWTYERTFTVPASLLQEQRVELQCDGLDTFAHVAINGTRVAEAENMHRRYAWDVKQHLKPGANTIRVDFFAVNAESARRFGRRPIRSRVKEGHPEAYPGFVRKMACNFGWDWGPVLVTMGIWRSLRLVGWSTARIADLRIDQDHGDGPVELGVDATALTAGRPGLQWGAALTLKGKTVSEATAVARSRDARLTLAVERPQLWWPNGMGDQPLYELKLTLLDAEGRVLDTTTRRIGLRTLRLDRHADAWGESFQFVVNGVSFFAKGANWIPVDAIMGRRGAQDYRRLVGDAAEANMNMLRVWGGGIYEDEAFYAACDERGVCVWQDFMFACMGYPAWDKTFMRSVEAEARDNVQRLRHHACIALWCGNNELEQQAVGEKAEGGTPMTWKDYGALFDDLLARVVAEEVVGVDYWPSSPHSPHGDRADYNNPTCGDAHLWGVWHGKEPFEWFRTCEHRFNSEFGFQAFPEPKTVHGFTRREDRNITSAVMEHHQRSGIGNATILHYMLDWFRLPSSFDMQLWTSQILQGMAIRYACEHWRRSMPRGMGTLYWQLNDVWPVASWSSIDYHGRWKALHHMARQFFAPLLVSGVEDHAKGTVEVHVTSDLPKSLPAELRWTVTDAGGRVLRKGAKRLRTPANGSRMVTTLRLPDVLARQTKRDVLVWLELTATGQPRATNLVMFARPKHLELDARPGISAALTAGTGGTWRVALKAKRAALWAWIELEGVDARCSDNFMHLRPGRMVRVDVMPGKVLSARDVRRRLRVRSLVDTYAGT